MDGAPCVKRIAVRIPAWTPVSIPPIAKVLGAYDLLPRQADILERLITDARMEKVWNQLLKRDRNTGRFLHPARMPADHPPMDETAAQLNAIAETFHFVFYVAVNRLKVGTLAQIAKERRHILARAASLRREAAMPSAESGEAETIRKMADRIATAAVDLRAKDDPLTVTNQRGDPVERGVQVTIAVFLLERFGTRLDRTAATLTAVALGLRERSPRSARSALVRKMRG